jgi:hypothetical protein
MGAHRLTGDNPVDVMMERCMLYGGSKQALILTNEIPPSASVVMLFANNTITDFDIGLLVQANLNWSSDIVVNNNLFYKIKTGLVQLDKVDVEKVKENVKGMGNVYHATESKPGALAQFTSFAAKALAFDLPTSDREANSFLRFGKSSPLATAGFDKALSPVPVGALDPLQ